MVPPFQSGIDMYIILETAPIVSYTKYIIRKNIIYMLIRDRKQSLCACHSVPGVYCSLPPFELNSLKIISVHGT